MANQIANIGILVKDFSKTPEVNAVLHTYSDSILNRSGMPYKEKNIRLINVTLDAPLEVLNELSTKLSVISGVTSKIMTFEA